MDIAGWTILAFAILLACLFAVYVYTDIKRRAASVAQAPVTVTDVMGAPVAFPDVLGAPVVVQDVRRWSL